MLEFDFEDLVPDGHKPVDPPMLIIGNKFIQDWRKDVVDIRHLKNPERVPFEFLVELGFTVQADIVPSDTEETARSKVANAILSHRERFLFKTHYKILIDSITGLSSSIILSSNVVLQVLNKAIYEGVTGYNSLDDSFSGGVTGYLPGITPLPIEKGFDDPGFIFIDLGGDISNPTQNIIDKVIATILLDPPAFLVIIIGFLESGEFVIYPNGVI